MRRPDWLRPWMLGVGIGVAAVAGVVNFAALVYGAERPWLLALDAVTDLAMLAAAVALIVWVGLRQEAQAERLRAEAALSLGAGGFAYIPPGVSWSVRNRGAGAAHFHWLRKLYQRVADLAVPDPIVADEADIAPAPMPGTEGRWATTRFVDPADLRHDMHVTIVTFEPGASIPFAETHVMEHGLYVLEGKAVYRLNQDWVEVEAGDYMWLRAFCPQACYAGGPGRFRYLLYKDVNRHMDLRALRSPGRG